MRAQHCCAVVWGMGTEVQPPSWSISPVHPPTQITPGLPKTRSGKIMRRILRKVAAGEMDDLGDTSTLADPSVVQAIKDKHQDKQ